MNSLARISAIIFFLYIESAVAIVVRHDIDEQQYRDFSKQYSASMAYINGCAGTLISSHWVVTAAHCVYGSEDTIFDVQHLDNNYRIDKIIVYPKYNFQSGQSFDIALAQLKDPILNGEPALLYGKQNEKGKNIVFVGKGMLGNGKDGLIEDDRIQRAATNKVHDVSSRWLIFKFNEPADGTPLEGISGPGDSGGPAFIEVDSKRYIAGVSSWQEQYGKPEGMYNVQEHYTRVSTYKDWIESTIKNSKSVSPLNHPVIEAVKNGDIKTFRSLSKKDKRWMSNSKLVDEAISLTLLHNNIMMMEELIDLGFPVSATRFNHYSLYEYALLNSRRDYFLALLNKTSAEEKIHDKDSKILPLLISRFINDDRLLKLVKSTLKQGANINAVTPQGDTALLVVGWNSENIDLVKFLVEQGADINIANNNGDTPLMDAAYLGKEEIFQYLLAQGANTQLKNRNDKTALDLAKLENRTAIISLLSAK